MEVIDAGDTYAYIEHDTPAALPTNPDVIAAEAAVEAVRKLVSPAPVVTVGSAELEARKLLMPDDVAPIAGDFAAAMANIKKASPAVAAAEAAMEEARKLVTPAPPTKALAAIDADAPAETIAPYAEYQADSISVSVNDYAIRVKEYQDEHGRQFYEFDNGRSKPLLACIFHTTAGHLISLNGVVAPLASFQSIVFARTAPAKVGKEAKRTASRTGGDLRAAIPVGDEKVLCTLTDGQQLSIPNTTVQHVMMALQRLAPPAMRVETEQTEEQVGPLRRLWRWLY